MKNFKRCSKIGFRLSAFAALGLLSISLIGCGDEQPSGSDYQQPEYRVDQRDYQPETSPPPSAPAPTPFPDFYGDGPGGSFYGH
ncbi:MAG: hypothetical protein WA902_07465 [Thermosynechococcaceae cyanobacterium]